MFLQSCIATLTSVNKDSAMGIFFYSLLLFVVVVVCCCCCLSQTPICPMEFHNTAKRPDPFLIQGLLGSNLQFR